MIKTFKEFITEERVSGVTVYHGSNTRFSAFSQDKARILNDFYGGGIAYFTDDKKIGIQYAKAMSKKSGEPLLYECKINLKNCFDVDSKFTGPELAKLVKKIGTEQFARQAGLLNYGSDKYKILAQLEKGTIEINGDKVFKGLTGTISTAKGREILKDLGFDGLRYNGGLNMKQTVQHNVYLPYYAESIKIVKRFKVNV